MSELSVSQEPSPKGALAFVKKFAHPGDFFSAANLSNFTQSGNPIAIGIAGVNLAYSLAYTALPDSNPIKRAFRLVGKEHTEPLRITSYCALTIGAVLLVSASGGASAALFPGLAAVFFGIGNFIQSDGIKNFLDNPGRSAITKDLLHPAIWYGLGYTMTGITIGGGLPFFFHPLAHKLGLALTTLGVAEVVTSLGLMITNEIKGADTKIDKKNLSHKNAAAPFVGVAGGTLFFAASGIATGNLWGAATGLFACAGELSLAVQEQQKFNLAQLNNPNKMPVSKTENFLTKPVRYAMSRGWIASLPADAIKTAQPA